MPTDTLHASPFRRLHYCPTCKEDLSTIDRTSAHHLIYAHLKNVHGMRINVACHATCIYIKPEKVKRVRKPKVKAE